jgi:hypothetical protein
MADLRGEACIILEVRSKKIVATIPLLCPRRF